MRQAGGQVVVAERAAHLQAEHDLKRQQMASDERQAAMQAMAAKESGDAGGGGA